MHLSDSTFLNIENEPSTFQEVTGAYLSAKLVYTKFYWENGS